MCEDLKEALKNATTTIKTIAQKIDALNLSCEHKSAFMKMVDVRGFRDSSETYQQMQIIGDAKSEICISLLDGKGAGLIVSYYMATQLTNEKERALIMLELESSKLNATKENVLLAILTIKARIKSD